MKKTKLMFLLPALVLLACESDLPLPKESYTKRLVVNGLINNTKNIEVVVSKTMPIGQSPVIEFPENALVLITDNIGNSWPCTYNLGLQKYVSNLKPQAGKDYSISVKLPGFADASARLIMPKAVSSIAATWKDSTSFDADNFPLGTISVRIDDKPGEKNHYRIGLFYYDVFAAEWKIMEPVFLDADIEEDAIMADDGSFIFSDRAFDGQSRDLKFVTPFGYTFQSPKFLVEKESLNEDYYNFFKSLRDYKEPGGVFTEVTPVFSNIKNGVGIWAGSYLVRDTIN